MDYQNGKRFKVIRTGQNTADLVIERSLNSSDEFNLMEYSYCTEKKTETYRFLLPLDELYQLTQDALRASSEIIKIQRPGV